MVAKGTESDSRIQQSQRASCRSPRFVSQQIDTFQWIEKRADVLLIGHVEHGTSRRVHLQLLFRRSSSHQTREIAIPPVTTDPFGQKTAAAAIVARLWVRRVKAHGIALASARAQRHSPPQPPLRDGDNVA
ncbi:hypothetical protein BH20VER1_BH20VER1_22310 [soil metagenome]